MYAEAWGAHHSGTSTSSCFVLEMCFQCAQDPRDQSSLWDNRDPAPPKHAVFPQPQLDLWVSQSLPGETGLPLGPIRAVVSAAVCSRLCCSTVQETLSTNEPPVSAQEEAAFEVGLVVSPALAVLLFIITRSF